MRVEEISAHVTKLLGMPKDAADIWVRSLTTEFYDEKQHALFVSSALYRPDDIIDAQGKPFIAAALRGGGTVVAPQGSPSQKEYMIYFIDLHPGANWAHGAVYLLQSPDKAVAIAPHSWPPADFLMETMHRIAGPTTPQA
jgi:hypothetical protein